MEFWKYYTTSYYCGKERREKVERKAMFLHVALMIKILHLDNIIKSFSLKTTILKLIVQ